MLKKHFLILFAASLIAIAAPLATAQDAQPGNQPPAQQPAQEQQNGGRYHGSQDPAKRTEKLSRRLKLSSDQQAKVQDILQSERSQMESLRQDSSTPQHDRRAKMMDIHQKSDTQIRALLDSTQQEKWDKMQAKHEERNHKHNGGDQPPPPPQQS